MITMIVLFYLAAAIAVISTVMVISQSNIVHALLYLIVSLLSIAVVFYVLGAPFAAVLEAIVYAGAIMVLFLFVMMMLNLGQTTQLQEKAWLSPRTWIGPACLALILLVQLLFTFEDQQQHIAHSVISVKDLSLVLFGPYLLAVELASMLLLAGLVGAYHIAKK